MSFVIHDEPFRPYLSLCSQMTPVGSLGGASGGGYMVRGLELSPIC